MITEEKRKKIVNTVINYILNTTNNKATYRDYFLIGKEIEGMLEILCIELLTEKMVSDALQSTVNANVNNSTNKIGIRIGIDEPYA
jgi:hypothetical protein